MLLQGFHSLPLPVAQLTLSAVLKCGQSFRWHILPLPFPLADPLMTHEYRFCLRDRVVCLRQSEDTLFYRSVFPTPYLTPDQLVAKEVDTLNWLTNYFQLEVDLIRLYDDWGKRDLVFGRFRDRFAGIRILRQDPWENLVSYVSSRLQQSRDLCQTRLDLYAPRITTLLASARWFTHFAQIIRRPF